MFTNSEIENKILTNTFDVSKIRNDFPILKKLVHGKQLVYFDNAATTHKPIFVINKINEFYKSSNSNIHRGVHYLSQKATDEYENARKIIANFINAKSKAEIIFTKGTTDSINLAANSFGKKFINQDDEIIISCMEHHSNIVPWQILCEERKAKIKIIPINDSGEIIFDEFKKLINEKTKLISVVHVSNSLGTINPIKEIINHAHLNNIPVLIDGAQSIQHLKIDVQELDCDFFAFSGHKIYGPTGIGVFYGKEKWLELMPPYQGGGDMISSVSFEKTTFNELPYKFEAGTPNIEGGIGLGAALDYINIIGRDNISFYEKELFEYAQDKILTIERLTPIGTAINKSSVISFILDEIHPHDIGTILDFDGIAIRTGHHCTQPVMKRFNVPATARISLAFYNTKDEIDFAVESIQKVFRIFG